MVGKQIGGKVYPEIDGSMIAGPSWKNFIQRIPGEYEAKPFTAPPASIMGNTTPAPKPSASPSPSASAAADKPAEDKPAENKPAEDKPAENKPAEAPAADNPAPGNG